MKSSWDNSPAAKAEFFFKKNDFFVFAPLDIRGYLDDTCKRNKDTWGIPEKMMQATKQERIYQLLKERIEREVYAPGCCLPKEVELAAELGIARKTLRPALEQLAMEGLIERIKGKGTFVRDKSVPHTKILVILHDSRSITNPFLYILPGIQLAAEHLHVALESCSTASLLSRTQDEAAEQIVADGFQGILVCANNFNGNEPIIGILRKTGLPVVLPHAKRRDQLLTGFCTLGTDYRNVLRDGLRYLATQGHVRVGNITLNNMRGIGTEEYFDFVREAGLDDDPDLLALTNSNAEDGEAVRRAAHHLMEELSDPPTALFCFSDFFALQTYEYLHERNIRIPDDAAVLSIGGQIGCNFLNPPLSAIDFGSLDIGRSAVRILLEMIHDKRQVPFIVTPHRITERASTRKMIYQRNHLKEMSI